MKAIDNVYAAIDDLIAEVPGWSKFILRASEPMFQLLDSIESILKENDSERTGDDDNTDNRGSETEEEATSA